MLYNSLLNLNLIYYNPQYTQTPYRPNRAVSVFYEVFLMAELQKRFYRDYHKSDNLKSYQITIIQSDLYIASTNHSKELSFKALNDARCAIENIIKQYPGFSDSLKPFAAKTQQPPVSWMINAANLCNVGPMAAVAGAVSRYVGETLLSENDEVIVENGGDIFMSSKTPRKILIYAGTSPISMKMAIEIPSGTFGICTSSGTVGPSLSLGKADAAVVVSRDCALADAAATRLGNLIKSEDAVENAVKQISLVTGVSGALAVYGEKIAACGQIKLLPA